jgi:hypothetical protein
MRTCVAVSAIAALCGFAPSLPAQDAQALRERHAAMREELAQNVFGRPIHVESSESGGQHRGAVYAVLAQPFKRVAASLARAAQWCDVLILQANLKHCEASDAGAQTLGIFVASKPTDSLEHAHRAEFSFDVAAAGPEYLNVALDAAEGPLGTNDYHIRLEATPLDAGRTFLHLAYSYSLRSSARMGMSMYLATSGRDKVGFSVVERSADGKPVHVGGVRGIVERNVMRHYLALEAYLGTLEAAATERLGRRLRAYHAGLERYPRQLRELELGEYLEIKTSDALRVQQARQ